MSESERTVIIVGKGLTAPELPEWINRYPDAEVWRLNDDMRYSDRCDRMYQLHLDATNAEPINRPHQTIVHEAKAALGVNEVRARPLIVRDHNANTICRMMHDAYYRWVYDVERIVMVGCDFLIDRIERETELPHVMWWKGFLESRGIRFSGPEASAIFHKASYPPATQQP